VNSISEYIINGGIFMYPIIGGTIWAIILLIERTIFYWQTASMLQKEGDQIETILTTKGISSTLSYLETRKGLIPQVVTVALKNHTLPLHRIEEKMDVELLRHLPLYSKSLNLLAILAGLMPILGLLGTVTGMIATFTVIKLQGTGDAQSMAGGIAEALITTQAGLVASLPIILGHLFITDRLKRITDKTREVCAFTIDYLKDQDQCEK